MFDLSFERLGDKNMMRISQLFSGGLIALVLAALTSTICSAQLTRQDSIWLPLKVFVGSWQGKGGGEPGIGDYTRTYQFVLNKKFIEIRNKSVYPSTKENLKGEVHEDWGYFSYDKRRHTFVLRQFHVEGFVNQYALESISEDGARLVFVSEAIENIAPGWRAKESYEILDSAHVQETFELAEPGKPFGVYTKVILNRVN
jgi:hypothetical protein